MRNQLLFRYLCLFLLIGAGLNAEAQTVLLVGSPSDTSGLPLAERNAYGWALSAYGEDAGYESFSNIAANGLPEETRVVWFHWEDDPVLPADANNAAGEIEDLLNAGGGLLVSGFATEYALSVNSTNVAPTQTIDVDPAGPDVAWGFKAGVGQETHPIFAGIPATTDWVDPNWGGFRTISDSVAGREALRWWTAFAYPGTGIAVMPWWGGPVDELPVVGEISKGKGKVMTCTAPGFNWISSAINGINEQTNLEMFTSNMLDYLMPATEEDPTVILLGDAPTLAQLPSAEVNAYSFARRQYGFGAKYMTFAEVASTGMPNSARAAWFHWEDDPIIPAGATGAAANIQAFAETGGGVMLSAFATQLSVDINATSVAPNEIINVDPAGPDVAWGFKPGAGLENHPIFAGIPATTDWVDPNWGGFRTISDSVAGREAMAWWTMFTYTGTGLAVMPWWGGPVDELPVVGEFSLGNGTVLSCTAPGFNWVSADTNGINEQMNLEMFTSNMLDYITPDPVDVKILLVGDAPTMMMLPVAERNAYSWARQNYGFGAEYRSFSDIEADGVPAGVTTIWFHWEDDPVLPLGAAGAASNLEMFLDNAGAMLVSGFATQFVVDVNATTVAPNETIDKDPAGPDAAWGIKPGTGLENHPIFEGIPATTDWADPNWGGFRTISDSVAGREAMSWWTQFTYPGTGLAVMPWWGGPVDELPVVGEIQKGYGKVITCTAPGYNWVSADTNGINEQTNIQLFTENMLDYAGIRTQIALMGTAPDVASLSVAEKNAYEWAISNYGEAAGYVTFSDVSTNGVPPTVRAIWYHQEDSSALPAEAVAAAANLESFISSGGGVLLSGFATGLVTDLNVTTVAPDETIDNDPAGPDVAWGIRPLDRVGVHPIFSGLPETMDWVDPNWRGFRTISDSVAGREAIRWWTAGAYPGTPLATMPWQPGNSDIPTVGEITFGSGGVMTATAPGFNWVNADINGSTEQDNLELFTANMIDYMAGFNTPQSVNLELAAGGTVVQEGNEDGVIINVETPNAVLKDTIDASVWVVDSLPGGISYSIARVDNNHATITLSGTAVDYNSDITGFTVKIPAIEFANPKQDTLSSVGQIVFEASTVSIDSEIPGVLVKVYPNPTQGSVIVSLDLDQSEQIKVRIMDLHGRIVVESDYGFLNPGRHEMNHDISILPDGLYLYDILSEKGVNHGRLILQK